jgi:hypothetical protein
VIFIGKAQEKCAVYRTEKRHNPKKNTSYAWIVKSTALVNQYYFYCVDENFGPFFLKFCSYFPYNAKLCLNGHEYATINNTRDFYIGKSLRNLPALRQIGFQANRRLLQTQRITHDSILAEETFQQLNQPRMVDGQRVSALRFADPMVQAIWNALLLFELLPTGFSNREPANQPGRPTRPIRGPTHQKSHDLSAAPPPPARPD